VVGRTARHVAATADKDRKAIAQVFTPASVARFMAARASRIGEEFTLIDAGAGVGVLPARRSASAARVDPHSPR
jgi:predicted RNA methylase